MCLSELPNRLSHEPEYDAFAIYAITKELTEFFKFSDQKDKGLVVLMVKDVQEDSILYSGWIRTSLENLMPALETAVPKDTTKLTKVMVYSSGDINYPYFLKLSITNKIEGDIAAALRYCLFTFYFIIVKFQRW